MKLRRTLTVTTFLMTTNQFGVEAYELSELLTSDMEPLCQ